MGRRKKREKEKPIGQVQLNVMPFVDIFSLLCTFLLFSAVFIAIGIVEVQVPFLSNAAPPKDKPKRSISVNVEVEKKKIILKTAYSAAPANPTNREYGVNKDGLKEFHKAMVSIKKENPESNKVTMLVEDDVLFDKMIAVLDRVKFVIPEESGEAGKVDGQSDLFPKVVIASVML